MSFPPLQTLAKSFERTGTGLHSGATVTVRVHPARAEEGRYFVRVDQPQASPLPARLAAVGATQLSTELVQDGAQVRTVEHLLAALVGSGIDCARIELDGPEVPLLDGSARDWVTAIAQAGCTPLGDAPPPRRVTEPITVQAGEAFALALPALEPRFTYGIDFPYPAIGKQWHSWSPAQEAFATEIAPARTFGFADQIEQLRQAGLIAGGSLENALVCDDRDWLNPPLRFANEPVRHKLLDLVGDLSLLGRWPQAHIVAYKASHRLHVQLAAAIAQAGSCPPSLADT